MTTTINNHAIDSAVRYKQQLGILLVDLELAHEAIEQEANSNNPDYARIRHSRQYVSIAIQNWLEKCNKGNY